MDDGSRVLSTAIADQIDAGSVSAAVERQRARGLRVVATSGCFDILHVGHTRFLQAARRLGDLLVVLLNSDDSVRRLKGPGRPLNRAVDRASVLLSLSAVDFVWLFDEDVPRRAVQQLRPHLFVAGGDYTLDRLPVLDVLRRLDVRVEILPYWRGHSTTRLIAAMAGAGSRSDLGRADH